MEGFSAIVELLIFTAETILLTSTARFLLGLTDD